MCIEPPFPPEHPSARPKSSAITLRGGTPRAHEWPGLHVTEPHLHPDVAQLAEFLRRVVAIERDVILRGAQILTECQNVDVDFAQIAHHRDDFFCSLAHAEYHSGLRWNLRC